MKKYHIYSDKTQYEVSQEIFNEMNKITNHIHYQEQKLLGQCTANGRNMARCDGDCLTCSHHIHRLASVDELDTQCHTQIQDSRSNIGMDIACTELILLFEQADPQFGRKIALLYLGNCTDCEVAKALGLAKSTFADRKRRITDYILKYYRK